MESSSSDLYYFIEESGKKLGFCFIFGGVVWGGLWVVFSFLIP